MKRASLAAGRAPHVCALALLTATACTDYAPDGVLIELSPEVISSIDGTVHVSALVVDDRVPLGTQPIRLSISYTDRNGTDHAIDPVTGETDNRGAFEATFAGLAWEGTGTVTAEVLDDAGNPLTLEDGPVAATATFAVLDRTPPVVEILPPTTDLHVGPGLPLEVEVHVTDEIGVAEVWLEAAGELERLRSTVIASGTTDTTVSFRFDIPGDALAGPTITLYAMASDLSSNLDAATPVVLIVDPAVAIATPPGLDGDILVDGNGSLLEDPRALAVSPMDGRIYVADASGNAPCNGACIRVVDPDGTVQATVVVLGLRDTIEGVAFDASGDTLYYSDRQNLLRSMAWSTINNRYENPTSCNVEGNQNPQDPMHLVHDADLGMVVADGQDGRLKTLDTCTGQDPNDLTVDAFDQPHGVAADPDADFYVSDTGNDEVYKVDHDTGSVSFFESDDLDSPRGIDWLAGGTSDFADTLMIANHDVRTVESSAGSGTRPAAYLRNFPVDVDVDGTTMYVLTQPSFGDPGRIFVVTGF